MIIQNFYNLKMATYKEKFNKKHGFPKDKSHSVREIAKLSGISYGNAKKIVDKGEGAYHSNPGSVRKHIKSPEEWGRARVYASVNKGSKSHKIDKPHLVKK